MLRPDAAKLGFGIVIRRSNSHSNRRKTFVTMRCKISGQYKDHIRKFKCDDTETRKYECPFKLCGCHKLNNPWTLCMIFVIHAQIKQQVSRPSDYLSSEI